MKNFETEFKWDANGKNSFGRALAAFGAIAKLSAPANLKIYDTYLDHADERFAREKIAFRVRQVGNCWQATFKTRSEINNGKAVRREETISLAGVKNLAAALAFLAHKKTWKKLNVQNLKPRFTLRNHRRTFTVTYQKCKAELALDKFSIFVCGREAKMKEIELEFKSGNVKDFEALAAQFSARSNLHYAKISKVKTAETLRALWSGND